MARVLVIGSGGAGKSTLARRLAERTGLPAVHLDRLYWRPGWESTPPEEWDGTVARLAAEPRWIMDGNYGRTLGPRLAAADTVVLLDYPRLLCLWRATRRWLTYRGRTRADMAPGCDEQLSLEFVRWIWSYPRRGRRTALARIAAADPAPRLVVLRSPAEAERWLASVPAAGRTL